MQCREKEESKIILRGLNPGVYDKANERGQWQKKETKEDIGFEEAPVVFCVSGARASGDYLPCCFHQSLIKPDYNKKGY